MLIQRDVYLQKLIRAKDTDFIKVLSGIRRCGKSTLLNSIYYDYLLSIGIKPRQVIRVNFESPQFNELKQDSSKLYGYLANMVKGQKKSYIFLDEIQEVPGFETAINGLRVDYPVDIYITGSNSKMLSGELVTYIGGRFIEIKMQPLSFSEYVTAFESTDYRRLFNDYMKFGGMPYSVVLQDDEIRNMFFEGLFNTIVIRDITTRKDIRDINSLETVLRTVMSSIGSLVSANKIHNTMVSKGYKISRETVQNYLQYFVDAFILYKASRYDIRGKQYLDNQCKYYVSDMGIRNYCLGYRQLEVTHALENIIYLELLKRGYTVDVGKCENNEIDFVCRSKTSVHYVQVAYTIASEEKKEQELASFKRLSDNYPKIVISLDDLPFSDIQDGIRHINAIDFLLNKVPLE